MWQIELPVDSFVEFCYSYSHISSKCQSSKAVKGKLVAEVSQESAFKLFMRGELISAKINGKCS